jgi:predicted dinucleotide-utilizing enzyme
MSQLPESAVRTLTQRAACKTRIDALMLMVEAACMSGQEIEREAAVKALHAAVDTWITHTGAYSEQVIAHIRRGGAP